MRTGKNKPTLKDFLLEGVHPTESTGSKVVVDGEGLLWSLNWSNCVSRIVNGLVLLLSPLMVTRVQQKTYITVQVWQDVSSCEDHW